MPRTAFAEEGHAIALVGMFEPALDGSELEKLRGRLASSLPPLDLAAHADALVRVRAAVRGGELPTAHDVVRGRPGVRARRVLRRRRARRRVIAIDSGDEAAAVRGGPGRGDRRRARARRSRRSMRAIVIGEVGGDALEIDGVLSVPVERATDGL